MLLNIVIYGYDCIPKHAEDYGARRAPLGKFVVVVDNKIGCCADTTPDEGTGRKGDRSAWLRVHGGESDLSAVEETRSRRVSVLSIDWLHVKTYVPALVMPSFAQTRVRERREAERA